MPDDTKQNVLFPEDEPESVGSELVPLRGSRSDVSDEKLRRLLEFRFSTEDGESRDLGFTLPTLIYCTLPHRRSTEQSYRRQDPYTGARLELFAPTEVGLPFGSISRLFLARVMTSVVQTNRRTIYLGRSWRTAAENLGLATSGPGLTRFQDHVARCFYATFTLEMRSGEADPSRQSRYLRRFNVLSAAKLPPAAALAARVLVPRSLPRVRGRGERAALRGDPRVRRAAGDRLTLRVAADCTSGRVVDASA